MKKYIIFFLLMLINIFIMLDYIDCVIYWGELDYFEELLK